MGGSTAEWLRQVALWTQIPALPLTSCVTLGKLSYPSGLTFLKNSPYFIRVFILKWANPCKSTQQCPAKKIFFLIYYLPSTNICWTLSLIFSPWSTECIQPEIFLVASIAQFPFILQIVQNWLLCVSSRGAGWEGGDWYEKKNLIS